MRLTQFSDYALRTLLYLAVNDDRPVPIAEVAGAYRISHHHLVKVVGMLASLGLVGSVRGRSGGFRLSREPGDINVGWVVRSTEPDFHLVECFDRERDTCPITPACGLKHVLAEAQGAFLATLDRYTLADFLAKPGRRERLVQLWTAASGAELAVRR